ncbi:MAG: hypothetical protein DRJ52_00860 [Thermoprotei archaeon]|nr:MAG: hypothetical protein DRJ52_00860 [Thermoprotei archaeon]RLF00441.1 MAG: hypothetical protein DRJ63_02575 [Thermoprotei archaeon]
MKRYVIVLKNNSERIALIVELKKISHISYRNVNLSTQFKKKYDKLLILTSPISGRISALNISEEKIVYPGETLVVIESMKTHIPVKSPVKAKITKIHVKERSMVRRGEKILTMEIIP